jgi:hypothetical protein
MLRTALKSLGFPMLVHLPDAPLSGCKGISWATTGPGIKNRLHSKIFLNGMVFSRIRDGVDKSFRHLVT